MSHYVTEPNGYREPVIGKTGYAARPPMTVPQQFQATAAKFPDRPAMAVKRVARDVSITSFAFKYVEIDVSCAGGVIGWATLMKLPS